jgi:hypothetical protein
MSDDEIIAQIRYRLSPDELSDWFMRSLPEIKDSVLAVAKVDGIEVAIRDVKELFLSWIQQPGVFNLKRK